MSEKKNEQTDQNPVKENYTLDDAAVEPVNGGVGGLTGAVTSQTHDMPTGTTRYSG